MKNLKLLSLIILVALFAFSCAEPIDLEPGADIQFVNKKDGNLAPLDEQSDYQIAVVEYPDEGTMFEIEGAGGNSIDLFVNVLPVDLKEKTYELSLDDASKSNLSFTLKADGKTAYCCNANSSGSLTIKQSTIVNVGGFVTGVIVGEFDLKDGRNAEAKGSFTAVKK